jgi:hypothetical protein
MADISLPRFRSLSKTDCVNAVIFAPAMGGTFVSNCLNIGDGAFPLDEIASHMRDRILAPVHGYAEHERTSPSYLSDRVVFDNLFMQDRSSDIDLFLSDLELMMASRLPSHAHMGPRAQIDYGLRGIPPLRFGTIYFPVHGPNTLRFKRVPYDAKATLDAIAGRCSQEGVRIRFVIVDALGEEALRWAYERNIRMWNNPISQSAWRERDMLDEVFFRHPNSVVLPIDALVAGQIETFVKQMEAVMIGAPRNRDILVGRCLEFHANKVAAANQLPAIQS